MKFCIPLSTFELKYLLYCALLLILQIYILVFIYKDKNLISDHLLLKSFCMFLGYLLNIILLLISHINSKSKEKTNKLKEENIQSIEYIYNKPYEKHLSRKDLLKFFFMCLILLLAELISNILDKNDNNEDENDEKIKKYVDNFKIFEYLIIFLVSKYGGEIYYKHHYISFFIFIIVEAIKAIYFKAKHLYQDLDIITIILSIIYSVLYGIYYLYIKIFMKYKFISPCKINFIIGIIDTPLIIIIYLKVTILMLKM